MKLTRSCLIVSLGLLGCTSKGSEPSNKPPPVAKAQAPAQAAEGPAKAPASQPSPSAASAPEAGAASQPGAEVGAHGGAKDKPEQTVVHGLPNVSGVRYVDAGCGGLAPCKCVGRLVYGDNALGKVGITPDKLAEGVWCVFGDFDDNGWADAAFLAADWTPDGPAAQVQVLLFDEVGLRATAPLPKRMKSLGRAEAEGRQVLVEPAAAKKYHFVYSEAGRFELVKR